MIIYKFPFRHFLFHRNYLLFFYVHFSPMLMPTKRKEIAYWSVFSRKTLFSVFFLTFWPGKLFLEREFSVFFRAEFWSGNSKIRIHTLVAEPVNIHSIFSNVFRQPPSTNAVTSLQRDHHHYCPTIIQKLNCVELEVELHCSCSKPQPNGLWSYGFPVI